MFSITSNISPAKRNQSEQCEAESAQICKKSKPSLEDADTIDEDNAIQTPDSILANFQEQALQHIFRRLPPSEAFPFGLTCHWLNSNWKEAQKVTKAARLTSEGANQKLIFLRNINAKLADDDSALPVDKRWLSGERVNLKIPETSLFTNIQKPLDVFAKLRYLEVAVRLPSQRDFAPLFKQITAQLELLNTLKIGAIFREVPQTHLFDDLMLPLAELKQHPNLRHLSLTFQIFSNLSIQPELSFPSLPILKQLRSFSFHANFELPIMFWLIEELFITSNRPQSYGAHLQPGRGARLGLELSNHINNYKLSISTLSTKPALLLYFTYLKVQLYRNDVRQVLRWVPKMLHLQKVKLNLFYRTPIKTDYPAILKALSSLEHLQELAIDWELDYQRKRSSNSSLCLLRANLSILCSVRRLTLNCKCLEPALLRGDFDLGAALHLRHVFPRLVHLQVHFHVARFPFLRNLLANRDERDERFYRLFCLPVSQLWARSATRELVNWKRSGGDGENGGRGEGKGGLQKLETTFTFQRSFQANNVYFEDFTSLENLLEWNPEQSTSLFAYGNFVYLRNFV